MTAAAAPARVNKRKGRHSPETSQHAYEEIGCYTAIRDLLLEAAEKNGTAENLSRASAANDVVDSCLQTARLPYEAQFLREADANRERARCALVKTRIAQLREKNLAAN